MRRILTPHLGAIVSLLFSSPPSPPGANYNEQLIRGGGGGSGGAPSRGSVIILRFIKRQTKEMEGEEWERMSKSRREGENFRGEQTALLLFQCLVAVPPQQEHHIQTSESCGEPKWSHALLRILEAGEPITD